MNYSELANLYLKISKTKKRLEKTYIISEFLKKVKNDDFDMVLTLIQGSVFPKWADKKLGVATKLVLKAMAKAFGNSLSEIENEWRTIGDLGEVASKLAKQKKQATLFASTLDLNKVFNNLQKLPSQEGAGSVQRKVSLIAELLTSASPIESIFIVRTTLEDMRVGIGDGTMRDAIAWAFLIDPKFNKESLKLDLSEDQRKSYKEVLDVVQNAYDLTNDFTKVAIAAKEKGLEELKNLGLQVGIPVKVMLYQKESDTASAFKRLGKPLFFEYKYDGFRLQVHKSNDKVQLFTRRLEEVTLQFPDVVEYVKSHINVVNCILDGEVIGYDKSTQKYVPFQEISQRIKRKHGIMDMIQKLPVELVLFDILFLDGETLVKEPFEKRRALLSNSIKQEKKKVILANQIYSQDEEEAREFFNESIETGYEGLMAKRPDAIYKPGARVGYGVKIKSSLDTLDLVIIGAEWGEGKRAGWTTSLQIACMGQDAELLPIGKVGTGLKEKPEEGFAFSQITELLRPLIKKELGRHIEVVPKIIIEVRFEEIQRSPSYKSGFALRFPRFVQIREDKPLEEISTIDEVESAFYLQKGGTEN